MARASRKSMHHGTQGKGDGTGAMTNLKPGLVGEKMVLSNRDKGEDARHRGYDSKHVQTEQLQDHAGNRGGEENP